MWKKGLMKYEEEINEGGIECNDAFQSKEPLIIEDINDIFSLGVEGLKCWFATLELAYDFYNQYAKMKGFVVCKGTILRNKKGEELQQTFVCHDQGYREDRGLTPSK